MLTIPKKRIQMERNKRKWSQERLADEMTAVRLRVLGEAALELGVELPPFTLQQVARVENGRREVRFDEARDPLWWVLVTLEIPVTELLGSDRQ